MWRVYYNLIIMHKRLQWFCAVKSQSSSLIKLSKLWDKFLSLSVPLRSCVYWLTLFTEGAADRLGLQEREEPRECIRPHVPHGHDVSNHHWPHSGQGQVLPSHTSHEHEKSYNKVHWGQFEHSKKHKYSSDYSPNMYSWLQKWPQHRPLTAFNWCHLTTPILSSLHWLPVWLWIHFKIF